MFAKAFFFVRGESKKAKNDCFEPEFFLVLFYFFLENHESINFRFIFLLEMKES